MYTQCKRNINVESRFRRIIHKGMNTFILRPARTLTVHDCVYVVSICTEKQSSVCLTWLYSWVSLGGRFICAWSVTIIIILLCATNYVTQQLTSCCGSCCGNACSLPVNNWNNRQYNITFYPLECRSAKTRVWEVPHGQGFDDRDLLVCCVLRDIHV